MPPTMHPARPLPWHVGLLGGIGLCQIDPSDEPAGAKFDRALADWTGPLSEKSPKVGQG